MFGSTSHFSHWYCGSWNLPIDYQSMMSHDGDNIKVSFCPAPSPEVKAEIMLASVTDSSGNSKPDKSEQGKRSKLGPQPKFDKPDFNFKEELERLPFPVNIGEIDMSKAQQVQFLELIYDNQSPFSWCDEDLGLVTASNTPYLLLWTNLCIYLTVQFQSSYKLRYASVWIHGLNRALSNLCVLHMHLR